MRSLDTALKTHRGICRSFIRAPTHLAQVCRHHQPQAAVSCAWRAGGMPSPLESLYEEATLQASAALAFPVPAKYIARISSASGRPAQERLRLRLSTQNANRFRYARDARSET